MDDRVLEHRDSHASSSHEPSSEPTVKRREDLGKHSVKTHFLKTEIARSVKGPKLQGPVQKTHWRSRTSCRKFW